MLWKKITGTGAVLSLAVGGLFALAAPAQATTASNAASDCHGLTFEVDPNEDHRAWRATVDGTVVWKSGDFGDDLGNDHEKLVDAGWTTEGPFDVHVKARDAKRGTVTMQWWHVNPPEKPNGWTDWAGGEWQWEKPKDCDKRGEPVKPEVRKPTCDDLKGHIKIPDIKGVQYRLDGEKVDPGEHSVKPGTYEVTAEPRRPHGAKKRWELDLELKECPEEKDEKPGEEKDKRDEEKKDEEKKDELPVTGGSPGVAAGAALGLLTLGGGMYFLARSRRLRFTA